MKKGELTVNLKKKVAQNKARKQKFTETVQKIHDTKPLNPELEKAYETFKKKRAQHTAFDWRQKHGIEQSDFSDLFAYHLFEQDKEQAPKHVEKGAKKALKTYLGQRKGKSISKKLEAKIKNQKQEEDLYQKWAQDPTIKMPFFEWRETQTQ